MPFVRFTRRRTRPVEASTTASYQAFGAASSVRCQARRTAVTSPKRTRRARAPLAKGVSSRGPGGAGVAVGGRAQPAARAGGGGAAAAGRRGGGGGARHAGGGAPRTV